METKQSFHPNPPFREPNFYLSKIYKVVVIEGGISYHSWGDNPFINGNHKVEILHSHFTESEMTILLTVVIIERWN